MQVNVREATKTDLRDILELYNQPDMDNGKILSIEQSQMIFDKIKSYPNYKVLLQRLTMI